MRQNLKFVHALRHENRDIETARLLVCPSLQTSPQNSFPAVSNNALPLHDLMTCPDILFLDEACANLDPASAAQIEALLLEARKGQKIILIT